MSIKLYNQTQTNPLSGYGLYDKENDRFNLEPGHILNATVASKNKDRTVLTTKDQWTFEVPSASIKGEVGDELTFQVVKGGKGNLALKQLIDQPEDFAKSAAKNGAFGNLIEIFKQSSLIREADPQSPAVDQETQAKTAKAISKIKRQMSYASDNLSQSAVGELIRSGVSLQKISLNVLNTVSHEIEKKPDKEISPEELAKRASEIGAEGLADEDARRIANALYNHGLPVAERNVTALRSALERADRTETVSPAAAARLIRDEKPVTLENMYIYEYSAKDITEAEELPVSEWIALKQQVEKVFDREGIDKTDEAYAAARFLLKNDLPVSRENMDKALFLLFPKQKIDQEEVLDRAAANLADEKRLLDINMMEPPRAKDRGMLMQHYQRVMKDLASVSTDTIEILMKRQSPLTLQNLRAAREEAQRTNNQYSVTGEDVSVSKVGEDPSVSKVMDTSSMSLVSAKRRLAEIQLKLTREAAIRLVGKGINIDTMLLEEAARELRAVEKEGYAARLRMTGGEGSAENVDRMALLYSRMTSLQPLTNNVFGDILLNKSVFSIEGMHRSRQAARAMEDLETFATVPSLKRGDSFGKVREQFGSLLTELEIEATDENIRAAIILSRSRIDINQENIDRTKLIDTKIEAIANKLHPTIAASMINEGLDPAEMHVDEVLDYIDRFNDIFGHDLKDKIASHIRALDNNNTIEPDDREKLIAVYRMLNLIQKNDGVSIGVALKSETSLTLGGLMESSKYYQRTRAARSLYNFSVDDEFGGLSQLNISEHKISRIMERAYQNSFEKLQPIRQEEAERVFAEENLGQTEKNVSLFSQTSESGYAIARLGYQTDMLDRFAENADPAFLKKLMESGVDLLNTPVEDLARMMRDENFERGVFGPRATEKETQRYMRQLQDMLRTSPLTIHAIEKDGIATILPFISAFHSMTKNPFHLGDRLNELDEAKPEADLRGEIMDTSLDELKAGETPEELLDKLHDKTEELREDTFNEKLLEQLDLIQNAIKVQSFVGRSREGFSLPIRLHDKITNLNMLVLNDNLSEAGRVLISLDTGRLGTVQAYLTMENDEITIEVSTNRPDGLEALEANAAALDVYLREAGINSADIRFGKGI